MAFFLTNGLISGMILATFFALCDGLFKTTTFQVLIDVSYVPHLDNLPSIVELLIHLLISIVVTFVLIFFFPRYGNGQPLKYLSSWVAAFSLLYIPMTLLCEQTLSLRAFLIWLIGHLLYTLYLGIQVERHR